MKLRFILLLFICYLPATYGQVDIFSSMDSTFNEYTNNLDDDFLEYIKEMDEDFYKYLGQEWTTFAVQEGMTRTKYFPDLRTTNIAFITDRSNPIYPKSQNKSYGTVSFVFFERQISVRFDPLVKIKLKSLSEAEISKCWRILSESDFALTISDIYTIKKQQNLNDWAVYCLVNQIANKLFPDRNGDKSLFSCFILTHIGYDVKLGRTSYSTDLAKSRLIILMPFTSDIFNQNRINIQNKTYYIEPLEKKMTLQKGDKIYSYQKNFSLAKNNVNLYMKSLPQFGSTIIQRKINSPYSDMNFPMRCVTGLVDFYNTYPDTEISIYLNTPLSHELKKSLDLALQPLKISGQSNNVKVEKLLKWFYYSFSYREDTIEKVLFAEQSPLQKYTDCEDRAIFFARIAKEILNLDVVLFEFDKHIATGICFNNKQTGYSQLFKGKKYIICDPSSKECKVGYIMEQLDRNKVFIIPLIQ